MIRAAAVVASLLVLGGCGSTTTRTVTRIQQCNGIAADLAFHYAICGNRFVRDGKTLAIGKPRGAKIGHWAKAFLSPDGKTFLAQWSAECEVPVAYLIADGRLRPYGKESVALGWLPSGEALIHFPKGRAAVRSMPAASMPCRARVSRG